VFTAVVAGFEEAVMADTGLVVLTVLVFAALVVLLRGAERL